jgi:hypothetical protein
MAYGLTITNDSNQVIIDSDLSAYHFIGAYYRDSHHDHTYLSDLGGEDYWDAPNTIDSNQTPGRVHVYSVNMTGNKPPMCFIKPNSTGVHALYASVIRVWKYSSTVWKVWVLQSSSYPFGPRIYVFSTMDQTNPYNNVTDNYGMQTFNSSGEVTFDSRHKPLRIIGAANALPPSSPNSGSLGSGTTPYLNVNATPNSYTTGANFNASDQIYYCPSLASACNEYELGREASGTNNWSYYTWSRYDFWWCFYRSAFRITGNNTFESNWAVYMAGHIWRAQVAGSFLGLGYLNGIPVVGADAHYPYSDSARNQGEANSVLISVGSYYV